MFIGNGYAENQVAIPTVDLTFSGASTIATVDENTQGFGNALHIDSDGNYVDAHADAAATMPCQALALETGTGAKRILLPNSFVKNEAWSFTKGAPIYVSESASGGLTGTMPASGNFVQIVGYAVDTNVVYFFPDMTVIERT